MKNENAIRQAWTERKMVDGRVGMAYDFDGSTPFGISKGRPFDKEYWYCKDICETQIPGHAFLKKLRTWKEQIFNDTTA